jgi:hypothetical protein
MLSLYHMLRLFPDRQKLCLKGFGRLPVAAIYGVNVFTSGFVDGELLALLLFVDEGEFIGGL